MTLAELISNLDELEDALTIYAVANPEWTASSEAIAALEPDDGQLPLEATGMQYFLEVSIAKDVLENLKNRKNKQEPSIMEKCAALIHYAKYDAYLP